MCDYKTVQKNVKQFLDDSSLGITDHDKQEIAKCIRGIGVNSTKEEKAAKKALFVDNSSIEDYVKHTKFLSILFHPDKNKGEFNDVMQKRLYLIIPN